MMRILWDLKISSELSLRVQFYNHDIPGIYQFENRESW